MRLRVLSHVLLIAACSPAAAFVPLVDQPPIIELPEALTEPAPPELAAAFEAREPGDWQLSWDPARGTLEHGVRRHLAQGRVLGKTATAAAAMTRAAEARAAITASLGDLGDDLQLVRCAPFGKAWQVTWQQHVGPVPILDAYLDLTILEANGATVAFRNRLAAPLALPPARLDVDGAVRAASRSLGREVEMQRSTAVAFRDGARLRPAWLLTVRGMRPAERWEVVVAADDGTVVRQESLVRPFTGNCTGEILPAYHDDTPVSRPLPWLEVTLLEAGVQQAAAITNGSGGFTFSIDAAPGQSLHAGLQGLYVWVANAAGDAPSRAVADVATSSDLHFGAASGRLDERTIYAHTNRIHDFVRGEFDFRMMDFPVPAVAGEPHYANAYWDGDGMHFGDGGSTFYNLGMFADVIYHEYTHGITDYMYRPLGGLQGGQGSALHEGLSDYFACTLTNESRLGEGLYRNGPDTTLRDLDHQLQWPGDAVGESHADGEIFAGALWDLRQAIGAPVTDRIVHLARTLGPRTFEAYANAVLLQDDLQFGDGQAGNGSPHRTEILAAFGAHGIGEAAGAPRVLVHAPLGDTESIGEPRTVRAGFDGHASSASDVFVLEATTGSGYTRFPMQRQPDGDFAAVIPGSWLGDGVEVRYFIRATGRRGVPPLYLPPGGPVANYSFRVGTDILPPTIEHTALGHAAVLTWPAEVSARIEDNLGLGAAWIETWHGGVEGARLGLVRDPVDSSLWTGRFANVGRAGDVIEYRIVAVDASRAQLVTCQPSCDDRYAFTLDNDLDEDFESGSAGFSHGSIRAGRGDPWRLRAPLDGASGHAWVAGGPDAGGEYAPGLAAALVTPSLQLGHGARVRVRSWIDAEPNAAVEAFDAGTVQIEIDGDGQWETLTPTGGYTHIVAQTGGTNVLEAGTPCFSGRDATWRPLEFDLTPWPARRVRIRFVFASDNTPSTFGYRGWALDDFAVDPGTIDPTDSASEGLPPALQASPLANPARGRLALQVQIPAGAGATRIGIYDVRGRWVSDLWRGDATAGVRLLEWDGTDARGVAQAAGVYYYRVQSGRGEARGKFVLLR